MAKSVLKSTIAALALTMIGGTLAASAGPFDELQVSEAAGSFAEYQSVYIAPVSMDITVDRAFRGIRRGPAGRGLSRPVSDKAQQDKAQDVHKFLTRELGKRMTVVDAPGEGVLTVETTVTRLLSTKPTLEELRYEPSLDFQRSVYAGGADLDIRLSENGTELASLSEEYEGRFNDGQPRIVVWQDADRAFRRTSRKLARYVAKN